MSTDVLPATQSAPLPQRVAPVLLVSAVLLVTGSGAVHLAVVPEHVQEYLPFGVFFAVVGLAQLGAAAVLLAVPRRRWLSAAAAGQALLVGLWLMSRTTGLPVGPQPWQPEPVGVADVMCVLLETLSVLLLGGLAARGARPRRRHRVRTLLARL